MPKNIRLDSLLIYLGNSRGNFSKFIFILGKNFIRNLSEHQRQTPNKHIGLIINP